MSLSYKHNLISRAKELRINATPQEKHLWYDYLCAYPIRFQRQKAIDEYIVDFYCAHVKLVIEIDGGQHYEDEAVIYDKRRTEALEKQGITVIRFTNIDIDKRFEAVCGSIDDMVKKLL